MLYVSIYISKNPNYYPGLIACLILPMAALDWRLVKWIEPIVELRVCMPVVVFRNEVEKKIKKKLDGS